MLETCRRVQFTRQIYETLLGTDKILRVNTCIDSTYWSYWFLTKFMHVDEQLTAGFMMSVPLQGPLLRCDFWFPAVSTLFYYKNKLGGKSCRGNKTFHQHNPIIYISSVEFLYSCFHDNRSYWVLLTMTLDPQNVYWKHICVTVLLICVCACAGCPSPGPARFWGWWGPTGSASPQLWRFWLENWNPTWAGLMWVFVYLWGPLSTHSLVSSLFFFRLD